MKAESSKVAKRRLSPETLELIRQRGLVRAAGNRELTSELAKQCRQAIKEDLKERRAAVMVEAGEARKSIRKAHRSFANYKIKMIALRRLNGTVTASRKAKEKIITEVKNRIAPGPDKIKSEVLENPQPVLVNTDLLFTCLNTRSILNGRPNRPC
uniref:V-type ATP synthase subunit D n=1 Tax=Angiostrongylus cantonensis TaxID=6313 RepID=A0A0K0D8G8_ANGCA